MEIERLDRNFSKIIDKTDDFARLLELIGDSNDNLLPLINCLKRLMFDIRNDLIELNEILRNE